MVASSTDPTDNHLPSLQHLAVFCLFCRDLHSAHCRPVSALCFITQTRRARRQEQVLLKCPDRRSTPVVMSWTRASHEHVPEKKSSVAPELRSEHPPLTTGRELSMALINHLCSFPQKSHTSAISSLTRVAFSGPNDRTRRSKGKLKLVCEERKSFCWGKHWHERMSGKIMLKNYVCRF